MATKLKLKMFKITDVDALNDIERQHRQKNATEFLAWANNTSFREIAEQIMKDRTGVEWGAPLFYTRSLHEPVNGIQKTGSLAEDYLKNMSDMGQIDILSISAYISHGKIILNTLVRSYTGEYNFADFYKFIGENIILTEEFDEVITGKLVIPDEIKDFSYTNDQIENHKTALKTQKEAFDNCTEDVPFLNAIESYERLEMESPEDTVPLVYDLKGKDALIQTLVPYEEFMKIFQEVMTYINNSQRFNYARAMEGELSEEKFMVPVLDFIRKTYINTGLLPIEDLDALCKKLHRALFQFYVVQDLIDDPQVTDIKITAPDTIRARVEGKAYLSNITFLDEADYLRFIDSIMIKNRMLKGVPSQTFTDNSDENYALRFSVSAGYVNSDDWPYLHIRKVSKHKLLGDDLIRVGMMDQKIKDYLLDCGKNSRGVVFAGPPGSGKTVCLNWFLEEAYEQSAEILVIQENDELFAYRKGIMFQHVVNFTANDEMPVDLEQLGKLALVAGCNVFVIGEAKGAEICSAITLSNSGCRTAITIHSPSSTETIDKMVDLAMRGYAETYDQAKRMLKSFQTIVYLENFKVKEISEITGYDDKKKDMTYRYIYRREDT